MTDKSVDAAKKNAIASAIAIAAIAGALSGALWAPVRDTVQMSAAAVWLLGSNWRAVVGLKPDELVEPMRPDFASLAPNDLERMQPGVTFMTGLFGDKLTARLVDENGVLLHEWPIDFFAEKRDKIYPYEALIHGAYLYENGDILINLDQKGLYRVDACGRIKWRNAAGSHHSIDVDEDGFIWTPVVQTIYSDKRIFPGQFSIDRIAKFDPETGDAIEIVDLLEAFVKSGAEGLVSGEFSRTRDVLHVNDVEILDSSMATAFPMFSAGDILVSSRQRNAVFVLDRETRLVKWMRAGASQFQHDPEFRADGTITVFDNRGSAIASEKKPLAWRSRRKPHYRAAAGRVRIFNALSNPMRATHFICPGAGSTRFSIMATY